MKDKAGEPSTRFFSSFHKLGHGFHALIPLYNPAITQAEDLYSTISDQFRHCCRYSRISHQ